MYINTTTTTLSCTFNSGPMILTIGDVIWSSYSTRPKLIYRYRQIFLIHYRLSEYRLNSISVHHYFAH